ncbi:hypothetical protein OC25_00295 [Pedobacter kyungheensis]|uniref:Lipoprotein n=1 Tax=Pedobacter kyungheensis TaxID=1069985 RepID=A0A0C1DS25_9SPHI|nr:hypothetical protein [Pedobacter kyungheensis]KIA96890.1 hypothetical protein OC25_00295 [Pedobacter kyungheensis]
MKTKAILVSLITLFIVSGCKNKPKQNSSTANQETQKPMIPIKIIEEIKQHLEYQKRVDSEEKGYENPYKMTGRDLELASIIMFEGLKNNGFIPVSEEVFNERIKEIFGIDNLKNPHYKTHATDSYITLFGNQAEDYNKMVKNEFEDFVYYDNYYLLKKEHLFFDIQLLDDLISINNDNSYKITIEPFHIHRNKYLFNNDKASFSWLFNNNKGFLSMLLEKYGYDKEPKINKMMLDSIYKENYRYPEFIGQLFFTKDSYNKLWIREGLLKYVEEHTSATDNRFIYALGNFMDALYSTDRQHIFDEDPSKKFTAVEKAEIVANIANIENPAIEKYKSLESADVWNNAGSSLYNLSVSHPEVIKIIEQYNYFGLPKMKAIIAKLQEEAPPTGADPEK